MWSNRLLNIIAKQICLVNFITFHEFYLGINVPNSTKNKKGHSRKRPSNAYLNQGGQNELENCMALNFATDSLSMESIRPWHSTAYYTRPDNFSFIDTDELEPSHAEIPSLEVFIFDYLSLNILID